VSLSVRSLVQKAERALVVSFGEETLSIRYSPMAVTTAVMLEDAKMRQEGRSLEGTIGFLAAILTGWNLVGDDEKPIPTTSESLTVMPLQILEQIAKAVMEDLKNPFPMKQSGS